MRRSDILRIVAVLSHETGLTFTTNTRLLLSPADVTSHGASHKSRNHRTTVPHERQISILYTTSTRLQRISRAPSSVPPPPSRAPRLHTSTSPRLHAFSTPSELHLSIPSRQSAFRDTVYSVRWPCKPSFRASRSRSPYLHVCTPAARLQSSRTPYLHVSHARLQSSRAPSFDAYTPAAHLPSSIPLRGNTPAARLQSSRTPYLHVCTPAAHLRRSIPLARLQRASRAPELDTSTHPRPSGLQHAARAPDFHTSMPPGPQHASRAPDLLRQIEATPAARL